MTTLPLRQKYVIQKDRLNFVVYISWTIRGMWMINKVDKKWPGLIFFLKTLITKVAHLLRSAACLQKNQSRSYLNHLVHNIWKMRS
jgi:hypothetical protein